MKTSTISIGIVCSIIIVGLVGLISLENQNVQGTNVSGTIAPPGDTWDPGGSPYNLIGDVIVTSGATLTIEPGVVVKFNEAVTLFIDGNLTAIGNKTDLINITSNLLPPASGDWERIQVNSSGHADIRHCQITYGYESIYLLSSSNNITDSFFLSNHDCIIDMGSSNNITGNFFTDTWNGISLIGSSNGIIKSNNFQDNAWGIYLNDSSNITIENNIFLDCGIEIQGNSLQHFNSHTINESNLVNSKPIRYLKDANGFTLDGAPTGQLLIANCTHVNAKNLHINNTDIGILVAYSSDVLLDSNDVTETLGICIYNSTGCTATDNIITGDAINGTSNSDWGIALELSCDNIIFDNHISLTDSGIWLDLSSHNNIVAENTVDAVWIYGIIVDTASHNNIIANNNVSNINLAITVMDGSLKNTVAGNNVRDNNMGIGIVWVSDTTITGNKIFSNKNDGVVIWDSSNNSIQSNNISGNDYGLRIGLSSNNKIKGNIVSNNNYGIYFESASDNNITKNDILNNNYGLNLTSSSNNRIYHNNIIDNAIQAVDWGTNQWDDGYPSGGNHWSDFDEPGEGAYDDYRGPNQNMGNSDGIVDKGKIAGGGKNPYWVYPDSWDNYPLMFSKYMYLYEGWNLISLPLIQSDMGLSSVLSSIDGSYDAVRWYNATDTFDPWKQNHTAKPQSLNDLHTLDHKMGFWIHIIEPGWVIFEYPGALPTTSQGIQLLPGWNLVGYPSLTRYNRTDGLNNTEFGTHINVIYWYDASTRTWHNMGNKDRFEKGRGYWIHSKVTIIWNVPL